MKKFLEETYGVLSENDSFFRKVNIHIIQCDDQVQTDQKITCEEELKEYMDKLELKGEGGTDEGSIRQSARSTRQHLCSWRKTMKM